ncbi:MAG: class IV adenylate cyclase [Rectinemataceae bacterium]
MEWGEMEWGPSMVEIELKARVNDPAAVEARLAGFLKFCGKVDKADEYWGVPACTEPGAQPGFRFRIRTEGDLVRVTFKEKTLRGSIEVNRETEFDVVGHDQFRDFVRKTGAKPLYRKHKHGSCWRSGELLAELVEVDGLGIFLEIETMREKESASTLEEARTLLYDALGRCGLDTDSLEPRYYSELLGVPKN